jgi:hypothetical protein
MRQNQHAYTVLVFRGLMRIDRLAVLASGQIEAALTWLAGQWPDVFDAVINAART